MKLKQFNIRRTESYQTPSNTLVGTVTLVDEAQGEQTVVLSPATIVKVLTLIQNDVTTKAREQANKAGLALVDGIAEIELASNPLISE